MKNWVLTPALLLFCIIHLAAQQHPLVGTWEMVSVSGINAEGESFFLDTTTVRETKIITPTHYILIAHDISGDSLEFNRAYAGTIKFNGNHFEEHPLMSSLQIVENLKTNFTWRIVGDRFIQSGTIIRPDGKKVELKELIFKRKQSSQSYPNNPSIGTWSFVSSATTTNGQTRVEKNPEIKALQVVTPFYWMGISYRNNKFENAMAGTYTMKNNKMYPVLLGSAIPMSFPPTIEVESKVQGEKLTMNGVMVSHRGVRSTWIEEWTRVGK